MFTLPRTVNFEWRCFTGHDVSSGEGENYCIDIHGTDRVAVVGPLCRECFIAHREAAHVHSA